MLPEYKIRIFHIIISVLVCSNLSQTASFNLSLIEPKKQKLPAQIYKQSQLQYQYNDTIYNKVITCTSGQLSIIEFKKQLGNASIMLLFQGSAIKHSNIHIQTNSQYIKPIVQRIENQGTENGVITIKSGCLGNLTNKDNYYSKVDVILGQQKYRFSFLLGCDQGGRDKRFQFGYFVIAIINAAITIGVALHSHIWSIRYAGRPLSLELKWHRYLIIMLIITVISIAVYFYALDQFKNANILLNYIGLIISYIFSFICADQIFFLVRSFKKEVYKMVRICDILSFIASTIMFICGFFTQSWIYYDILAIGICVGAIKLLRFSSMKQAYLSMAISVIAVSIFSGVLHFILQRSYNDYTSQLASPLFILIPDLIDQLYKKCSWLPVIDVIVPGVFLSFLRTYDGNYNTGWGGVYTVIGNLSFILSTLLWVLLEAIYPYSVPFSSVTYLCLGLAVFLMSTKRNQFKTLWTGRFNGANNELTTHMLPEQQNRKSFGKLVTSDIIDSIKYDEQKDRQSYDDQNPHKNKIHRNS